MRKTFLICVGGVSNLQYNPFDHFSGGPIHVLTNIPAVRSDAHEMETKRKHIAKGNSKLCTVQYQVFQIVRLLFYLQYHCNLKGK